MVIEPASLARSVVVDMKMLEDTFLQSFGGAASPSFNQYLEKEDATWPRVVRKSQYQGQWPCIQGTGIEPAVRMSRGDDLAPGKSTLSRMLQGGSLSIAPDLLSQRVNVQIAP